MNSKIGIVTLHGYYNYGNRLQNYALKYTLNQLGFNVDTTIIEDETVHSKYIKERIKLLPKSSLSEITRKSIRKLKNKLTKTSSDEKSTYSEERTLKFQEFSKNYLNEKFYNLTNSNDLNELNKYSFFITGSDQVWNPVEFKYLPIYFLTFTTEKKRISYSPSFAKNSIPEEYKPYYVKWLKSMSAVSVREDAGAKIIRDLTGIDAPVLVDPTMLLTKKEWLSISNCANNHPDKPYLLTYFLGGPTDKTREKLERIATEKNMEIINLGDITEPATYETGPSEFLDYINNASAFFTDSFHGVVFSIIFQTPFVVYERQSSGPSMYSRIETILDNFDMRDREAEGFDQDIFSMDFSGTKKVLEREYNKSIEYLKEALRIEE